MSISDLVKPAVFILGLAAGSFLNVCIWRLPEGEQVVRGRSRCPRCRRTIAWYDNIPVLSFVLLKGRCRSCKGRISWAYPAVELATAILWVAVVARFGLTASALVYGIFAAALLVASVVDARTMTIPDEITKPGLWIGLTLASLVPALHGTDSRWGSLLSSAAGAAVGWGLIFGMAWIGGRLFRKKLQSLGEEEAVGGGDLKLMAFVGAVIGAPKVLLVILFLAPLSGSLVGILLKIRGGRDLIPYGPFLSMGTLIALFWGEGILDWYGGLLRGT